MAIITCLSAAAKERLLPEIFLHTCSCTVAEFLTMATSAAAQALLPCHPGLFQRWLGASARLRAQMAQQRRQHCVTSRCVHYPGWQRHILVQS